LGGIYGPGRTRFIEAARTGAPTPGDPDGFINFIHRDAAAAALHHVGRLNLGGIWNAVDDRPVRRAELAEAIRNDTPLPIPVAAVYDRRIPVTGKRVANAKLRAAGSTPRYPTVIDALNASAV
jgi:nucleoside-diphosphate-sugar epimerase